MLSRLETGTKPREVLTAEEISSMQARHPHASEQEQGECQRRCALEKVQAFGAAPSETGARSDAGAAATSETGVEAAAGEARAESGVGTGVGSGAETELGAAAAAEAGVVGKLGLANPWEDTRLRWKPQK